VVALKQWRIKKKGKESKGKEGEEDAIYREGEESEGGRMSPRTLSGGRTALFIGPSLHCPLGLGQRSVAFEWNTGGDQMRLSIHSEIPKIKKTKGGMTNKEGEGRQESREQEDQRRRRAIVGLKKNPLSSNCRKEIGAEPMRAIKLLKGKGGEKSLQRETGGLRTR